MYVLMLVKMNHLRLLQLLQVSLNFLFSFLLSPKMSSCCSLSSLKKRINESFFARSRSLFFNQKTVDNDSIFDYCHLFPRSLSIKRYFFSKRWDRITIALQHQSTKSRWRSHRVRRRHQCHHYYAESEKLTKRS